MDLGHRRWAIENQGFNEAVNIWNLDHVCHHELRVIEVVLLLGMLTYNLLRVFDARNLKPAVRQRLSRLCICNLITADLYAVAASSRAPP